MKENDNNISLLVIEKSDDYIFSYNELFNQFLPFFKIRYVKTMDELQTELRGNSHYNIAISEVFIIGANWRNILHHIENRIDKIIFTSAYDSKFPPIKKIIKLGYTYIEKPFEIDELKEKVDLKFNYD